MSPCNRTLAAGPGRLPDHLGWGSGAPRKSSERISRSRDRHRPHLGWLRRSSVRSSKLRPGGESMTTRRAVSLPRSRPRRVRPPRRRQKPKTRHSPSAGAGSGIMCREVARRRSSRPAAFCRPGPPRPGRRPASAPSDGRTSRRRCRSAGGGPPPRRCGRRASGESSTLHWARVTRRTMARAVAPRTTPAEGAEVVRAQQDVGRRAHGDQVERVPHVPGDGGQQRVGRRRIPDQVAVGPSRGRTPGVELGRRHLGPHHDDLRRQLAVERPGQAHAVVGDGRQIDVDHLAPGVHPGVGPAGAGDHRRLAHPGGALQGQAQRAGHRRAPRAGGRNPGRPPRRRQ